MIGEISVEIVKAWAYVSIIGIIISVVCLGVGYLAYRFVTRGNKIRRNLTRCRSRVRGR